MGILTTPTEKDYSAILSKVGRVIVLQSSHIRQVANFKHSFVQVQEALLNDGLVDFDAETGAFSLHRLVQSQVASWMKCGDNV